MNRYITILLTIYILSIYRYPEATALVQRLITANPKHSLALLLLARVKADTFEANIGTVITLNNLYDIHVYIYICL